MIEVQRLRSAEKSQQNDGCSYWHHLTSSLAAYCSAYTGRLRFRREKMFPVQKKILEIKERLRPEPYDWYRFNSFANIGQLEKILPGGVHDIARLADGAPVADIGSADGDLAFVMESLGSQVTAIDWPGTNANRMLGLALLKRELGSSMELCEVDIDEQFTLPGQRFGVAVCLGLLYHLKNPYFFLEKLARHTHHCLLSTRILPPAKVSDAVAYLTGFREFEDDPTNFWFFSEQGLLRLLDRTGWDVVRHTITGDGVDDRFFCHLQSRFAVTAQTFRLTHGWHKLENESWRWTQQRFGMIIDNPEPCRKLELHFRIVPDLLEAPLVLSATVNGMLLPPASYTEAGDHVYANAVSLPPGKITLDFQLSHTMHLEERDLGLIIATPGSGVVSEGSGIRLG